MRSICCTEPDTISPAPVLVLIENAVAFELADLRMRICLVIWMALRPNSSGNVDFDHVAGFGAFGVVLRCLDRNLTLSSSTLSTTCFTRNSSIEPWPSSSIFTSALGPCLRRTAEASPGSACP